ncbi:hypothetical protein JW935_18965 [candidate division KSB1 bacterium]|nr:hypothetical protein [candidate division KSB1 bacterium]
MRKLLLISICISFSLFCQKKSTGPNDRNQVISTEDLLPKDDELSGWTKSGEHWNASSNGDLTTYINGEAVIYTNRGFVEASKQEYQGVILGDTESVEVRIFDQGTKVNAKSVYDEIVREMSNPISWDGAGEEARKERFSLSQRIVFYQDKYFVALSVSTGLDEALVLLEQFANNISSEIK